MYSHICWPRKGDTWIHLVRNLTALATTFCLSKLFSLLISGAFFRSKLWKNLFLCMAHAFEKLLYTKSFLFWSIRFINFLQILRIQQAKFVTRYFIYPAWYLLLLFRVFWFLVISIIVLDVVIILIWLRLDELFCIVDAKELSRSILYLFYLVYWHCCY